MFVEVLIETGYLTPYTEKNKFYTHIWKRTLKQMTDNAEEVTIEVGGGDVIYLCDKLHSHGEEIADRGHIYGY